MNSIESETLFVSGHHVPDTLGTQGGLGGGHRFQWQENI